MKYKLIRLWDMKKNVKSDIGIYNLLFRVYCSYTGKVPTEELDKHFELALRNLVISNFDAFGNLNPMYGFYIITNREIFKREYGARTSNGFINNSICADIFEAVSCAIEIWERDKEIIDLLATYDDISDKFLTWKSREIINHFNFKTLADLYYYSFAFIGKQDTTWSESTEITALINKILAGNMDVLRKFEPEEEVIIETKTKEVFSYNEFQIGKPQVSEKKVCKQPHKPIRELQKSWLWWLIQHNEIRPGRLEFKIEVTIDKQVFKYGECQVMGSSIRSFDREDERYFMRKNGIGEYNNW